MRMGECGGNFITQNGIFTSPSFPSSYPNNADCTYTISQPIGTIIMLKILSMDIDYADPDIYDYDRFYDHPDYNDEYHFYGGLICWDDYLEIRDGASEKSPLIDGYCGGGAKHSLPILIQTTQENSWIRCTNL